MAIEARSRVGTGLVAIVAALAMAGCATTAPERVRATQVPGDAHLPNGRLPTLDGAGEPTPYTEEGGLIAVLERRKGRPLQIMQISGGGQNGAFAAGILDAWGKTGERPQFDIVTGVSAGALVSTFAFLGTPEDDAAVVEVFTSVDQHDIYIERGLLAVAGGADAFNDPAPLRELLGKYITERTIERVAAAADEGRFLLIGTTNLDTDELWVWDLTAVARRGGPEARELYLDVLMASASPPIAFPPVEIAGYLFADGGTRSNLVVVGLGGIDETSVRDRGEAPGTMFVIHNGRLHADRTLAQRNLKAIIGHSLQANLDRQMGVQLFRAYLAAGVRGYDFRLAAIPRDVKLGKNMLAFNPEEMRTVFEAGRRLGARPNAWATNPPDLDAIGPWAESVPALVRKHLGAND